MKTKYDIGDELYTINNDDYKLTKFKVNYIKMEYSRKLKKHITYYGISSYTTFSELKVAENKKELLEKVNNLSEWLKDRINNCNDINYIEKPNEDEEPF